MGRDLSERGGKHTPRLFEEGDDGCPAEKPVPAVRDGAEVLDASVLVDVVVTCPIRLLCEADGRGILHFVRLDGRAEDALSVLLLGEGRDEVVLDNLCRHVAGENVGLDKRLRALGGDGAKVRFESLGRVIIESDGDLLGEFGANRKVLAAKLLCDELVEGRGVNATTVHPGRRRRVEALSLHANLHARCEEGAAHYAVNGRFRE